MTAFERAFELVVGVEGEYSSDPADPGGETKYGISQRAHPGLNIRDLTLDDARTIYRREYWAPLQLDDFHEALAILLFDAAVNQGPQEAIDLLCKAIRIQADKVTPEIIAAARQRDLLELTSLFMGERALQYVRLSNFNRFGRGWLKRLFVLQAQAFQNKAV